jgi:cyclic pyranopterin phosphate synthase
MTGLDSGGSQGNLSGKRVLDNGGNKNLLSANSLPPQVELFYVANLKSVIVKDFSHIDKQGRPALVNVGKKKVSKRTAMARSIVVLPKSVLQKLMPGDIHTKKGPVFQTAVIAGIMAAKRTAEFIPLCHPLGIENCQITIDINKQQELVIECSASITAKTGVEMEVLVGASIAALTVYDMCKSLSHDIVIKETKLIRKTGGSHDFKRVQNS